MDVTRVLDWQQQMTAEGYSPSTVETRVTVVLAFARAAGVDPPDLDRGHVMAYLADRPLGPRSRRAYLSHLGAWGRYVGVDLVEGIRRPRATPGIPRPISEPQLARLMLAARPGHRERAWLILGAYAGLRSFESAKVAVDDLEAAGDGWALRVVGKGAQLGLIAVPEIVADVLDPWIRAVGTGPLWPGTSPETVRRTLAKLGGRAGVRFTSHQLRHRYGTAMYQATDRSLLHTQQAMRHRSPATTAGYALADVSTIRSAVNRLPGATPGTYLKDAR